MSFCLTKCLTKLYTKHQNGATAGDRTPDLILTMDALCQLSYGGKKAWES